MTISAPDSLLKQLQVARRELLDLSTRNRLLHTARDQERGLSLEIKDESADQVFHLLVTDHQPMRFEQGELDAPDGNFSSEKPKTTKRVTKKKASLASEKKGHAEGDRQNDNVLHTVLAPE
jgi:hypothetical protein